MHSGQRPESLAICDVNAAFPHRAEVILAGTSTLLFLSEMDG